MNVKRLSITKKILNSQYNFLMPYKTLYEYKTNKVTVIDENDKCMWYLFYAPPVLPFPLNCRFN